MLPQKACRLVTELVDFNTYKIPCWNSDQKIPTKCRRAEWMPCFTVGVVCPGLQNITSNYPTHILYSQYILLKEKIRFRITVTEVLSNDNSQIFKNYIEHMVWTSNDRISQSYKDKYIIFGSRNSYFCGEIKISKNKHSIVWNVSMNIKILLVCITDQISTYS